MTDINTFQCQTATVTHCQNNPALGLSHTPSRGWEHSSGGPGCSACRALSSTEEPGAVVPGGWSCPQLHPAESLDTDLSNGHGIHENSPASSPLFPNSNIGSTMCLSWAQSQNHRRQFLCNYVTPLRGIDQMLPFN